MLFFPLALAFGTHPAPAVTVIGGTPERVATFHRVLQRFDDAGLELPPLVVTFHDDRDRCLGPNHFFATRLLAAGIKWVDHRLRFVSSTSPRSSKPNG